MPGPVEDGTREAASPLAPSVFIVSDIKLFREALAISLAADRTLRVAGDGASFDILTRLALVRPDVLLLDLAAAESLAAPRAAHAILPGLRIVAFAVAEMDVMACIEAGVCGYVARDGSVADVVRAVRHALSGEALCSPRVAAMLFDRIAALTEGGSAADPCLTMREAEVAGLLRLGLSNKLIARRLGLSSATVKNHVHNVLRKLGLERRGEISALRLPDAHPQRATPTVGGPDRA